MFSNIKKNFITVFVLSFLLSTSEFLFIFYPDKISFSRLPKYFSYNFILYALMVSLIFFIAAVGLGLLNFIIKRFSNIGGVNFRIARIAVVIYAFLFIYYWKNILIDYSQVSTYVYNIVFVAVTIFIGHVICTKYNRLVKMGIYGYSIVLLLVSAILIIRVYRISNAAPEPFIGEYTREFPNVVYIVIDTLRPDALSCYGNKKIATTAMDNLASDGILFENTYSSSNWTLPGSTTLLTSQYPSEYNMFFFTSKIPPEGVLVSEALQKQRYLTAAIVGNGFVSGKYGFKQGFDYFDSGLNYYKSFILTRFISAIIRYYLRTKNISILSDRKFYLELDFSSPDFLNFKRSPYDRGEYINSKALKLIDKISSSSFFLYLHYIDPHDPYFKHPYEFLPYMDRRGEKKKEKHFNLYLGEVKYADEQIGLLIEKLKNLGLYENTIIILTSDHGEQFYEHGESGHSKSLCNGEIRIPLIIKGIDNNRGIRFSDSISSIDILPTVFDMIGIDSPESFKGKSLMPYINNKIPKESEYILSSFVKNGHNYFFSLLDGNLKYIISTDVSDKKVKETINVDHYDLKEELYDLEIDKGEQRNIIAGKEEITAKYKKVALKNLKSLLESLVNSPKKTLSQEQFERIKALGYIQ